MVEGDCGLLKEARDEVRLGRPRRCRRREGRTLSYVSIRVCVVQSLGFGRGVLDAGRWSELIQFGVLASKVPGPSKWVVYSANAFWATNVI